MFLCICKVVFYVLFKEIGVKVGCLEFVDVEIYCDVKKMVIEF